MSGQVILGQVMTCWFSLFQVMSGYIRLFHVMTGYVWLFQVISLLFRLGQFGPGYIRISLVISS
jgi:Ni,Fe-hydrogenase I cytochrome b subunit